VWLGWHISVSSVFAWFCVQYTFTLATEHGLHNGFLPWLHCITRATNTECQIFALMRLLKKPLENILFFVIIMVCCFIYSSNTELQTECNCTHTRFSLLKKLSLANRSRLIKPLFLWLSSAVWSHFFYSCRIWIRLSKLQVRLSKEEQLLLLLWVWWDK